ncbi:hypothetical protein [Streptomyces cyaneofuscatus]
MNARPLPLGDETAPAGPGMRYRPHRPATTADPLCEDCTTASWERF